MFRELFEAPLAIYDKKKGLMASGDNTGVRVMRVQE